MSNIMDCPYGHRFSKTRYGTICPHCGFDLDTPEKVYVNLRKECGLSLREERPVCAWLVCIEGARKGKSYVISFGENFIGTDRDNEIQILGDEKIKKKHTLIYFDEKENKGMLLPARADGIVYIDNKAVYERRILKDQNILEIGKEKFIYVVFEGKYGKLWQECLEEKEQYKEKEKEDTKIGEQLRKYRLLKKKMISEEEKFVKRRVEKGADLTEEYPVCGWLVCTKGVRLGKSWVLVEEKNYVGSSDIMMIQILGDEEIRDKNHIVIVFDIRDKRALLLGEECMGFVRVNDKAEYRAKELNNGDKLSFGTGEYMYIDFVGSIHNWEGNN